MYNKFKKLLIIITAAILLLVFSSCSFILDSINNRNDYEPLESFVPQTVETVNLSRPSLQDGTIKPYFADNEPETNPVRPLEQSEETDTVSTQEELLDAAMRGRKPIFTLSSNMRSVYNSVLKVLNTIILNDMTDYEKILCIYDFIIYYTIYDLELLDKFINENDEVTSLDNSFNLKGVFYDYVAVCDGFSKAFSLMCSIENIKNVRITGTALSEIGNNLPHAWNKVMLGEKWYVIDSTYGNLISKNAETKVTTEYLTHAYFLVSDTIAAHNEENILSAGRYLLSGVNADEDYNFYEKTNIKDYEITEWNLETGFVTLPHNYVFNTKKELNNYVDYVQLHRIKAIEIYSEIIEEDIINYIQGEYAFSLHNIRDNIYFITFDY